jgi:hypothetical protein
MSAPEDMKEEKSDGESTTPNQLSMGEPDFEARKKKSACRPIFLLRADADLVFFKSAFALPPRREQTAPKEDDRKN